MPSMAVCSSCQQYCRQLAPTSSAKIAAAAWLHGRACCSASCFTEFDRVSRCNSLMTLATVACLLQMAPSFQELAQQQPALAMQFASECCIKGGMRFADDGSLESGKTSKANTGAASSAESSSRPSKSDDDTQAANSPAD